MQLTWRGRWRIWIQQFSYKLAGFGLNTEIMLINSLVSESPGLWPEERQLIPETFLLKLGVVFMTGDG